MYKYTNKVIYPKLSYQIMGVCFSAHKKLGRYFREVEYCDFIEQEFVRLGVRFRREAIINKHNRVDFIIENKIVLEIKAKGFVKRNDYHQIQRYLQISNIRLGLLINFTNRYLFYKRIIRIDNWLNNK